MNLFGWGLSVFLEICKYFLQVTLIYVVVLSYTTTYCIKDRDIYERENC